MNLTICGKSDGKLSAKIHILAVPCFFSFSLSPTAARRSLYASMTLPPMANLIVDIKFSDKSQISRYHFIRMSLKSYTTSKS
jgi:hypothetical protein